MIDLWNVFFHRIEKCQCRRCNRTSSITWTFEMQRFSMVSREYLPGKFHASEFPSCWSSKWKIPFSYRRKNSLRNIICDIWIFARLSLVRIVEKWSIRLCRLTRFRQWEWSESKCRNLSLSSSRRQSGVYKNWFFFVFPYFRSVSRQSLA